MNGGESWPSKGKKMSRPWWPGGARPLITLLLSCHLTWTRISAITDGERCAAHTQVLPPCVNATSELPANGGWSVKVASCLGSRSSFPEVKE